MSVIQKDIFVVSIANDVRGTPILASNKPTRALEEFEKWKVDTGKQSQLCKIDTIPMFFEIDDGNP